jgi:SAM-dependent methyltransferase
MSDGAVCRACGDPNLEPVLDLGKTPLANALLSQSRINEQEPEFDLVLAFCRRCSLVQITESVPPEVLFRNYLYFSSFSEELLSHAGEIARRMIGARKLNAKSLVLEIASNDGYLLQNYQSAGVPVLGIEPALNIAKVAREGKNIPTISEFFGRDLALRLSSSGRQADVVHANNVLAHVPDLHGFIEGLRLILKPKGVAVIEFPYVKDMIDQVEFDTIYHEHLSYFSLTALDRLMRGHGLMTQDVERLAIHGGSLRVFVGHDADGDTPSGAVRRLLADEESWGVEHVSFYKGFGAKVERLKTGLLDLLGMLKHEGRRIAAYGASAKGATLLNYFGIKEQTLDFVVDRSTAKQGLYTPGTHLPIYATEKLLESMPDYTLLLTWNFAREILEQQSAYRQRGGRFIVPIPTLQVVGP